MAAKSYVQTLRDRGFDMSRYNQSSKTWSPRCSCCEALVVCGTPCHESGCPMEKRQDRLGRGEEE